MLGCSRMVTGVAAAGLIFGLAIPAAHGDPLGHQYNEHRSAPRWLDA